MSAVFLEVGCVGREIEAVVSVEIRSRFMSSVISGKSGCGACNLYLVCSGTVVIGKKNMTEVDDGTAVSFASLTSDYGS